MKAKLVRIGNSRGVRIPKPMIEEAGLEGEVRLRVIENGIIIEPAHEPRGDWGEAAKTLHDRGEDGLLDEQIPTRFDELEWEWE